MVPYGEGNRACFGKQAKQRGNPSPGSHWLRYTSELFWASVLPLKLEPLRVRMRTWCVLCLARAWRQVPVIPLSFRWINPFSSNINIELLPSWVFKIISVINVFLCCLISQFSLYLISNLVWTWYVNLTHVCILSFLLEQCECYDSYQGYRWHHIPHLSCFSFICIAVSLSIEQIQWIFSPLIRNCLVQPQPLACRGLAFTISPSSSYLGCCHVTDTQVVGILLIVVERILNSNNVQNCEAKLSCCWKNWWQVWEHGVEFLLPTDIFLNLDVVLVFQFPALTKYPNWIA